MIWSRQLRGLVQNRTAEQLLNTTTTILYMSVKYNRTSTVVLNDWKRVSIKAWHSSWCSTQNNWLWFVIIWQISEESLPCQNPTLYATGPYRYNRRRGESNIVS